MKTEQIVKIKQVKCHCYDGTQCETALYAKSDSRPGYRWYVGYGADYMPAAKSDLDNMRDYTDPANELLDAQDAHTGATVIMYRNNI